jgi:uncharacterized protein YhdP
MVTWPAVCILLWKIKGVIDKWEHKGEETAKDVKDTKAQVDLLSTNHMAHLETDMKTLLVSHEKAVDTLVSIDKGIASTHNLQMKGVNALVQMEGTSDIAKESQNVRVVILPEVDAGTASLLAGIAVNPVVGLSTFLAQLFLRNPLSKATTQSFLIDGTWSNPKVTKMEAPTAPKSAP